MSVEGRFSNYRFAISRPTGALHSYPYWWAIDSFGLKSTIGTCLPVLSVGVKLLPEA